MLSTLQGKFSSLDMIYVLDLVRERRGFSANQTDVYVVWNPAGERHRATLQITVRKGKGLSRDVSKALDDFVRSAMTLQATVAKEQNEPSD